MYYISRPFFRETESIDRLIFDENYSVFYPQRALQPSAGLQQMAGSGACCSWMPRVQLPTRDEGGNNMFSQIRKMHSTQGS